MLVGPYLEKKQPVAYRTFVSALKTGRVSHAYLLSGEAGIPLKEIAIFLAKTILCDEPHPLACESCRTCTRIGQGEYADFLLMDGEKESIKKEAVGDVVASFSRTALERKGIMVYVIHETENMTVEAINSLLKFLEEPSSKTYAILTTRNEAKVLPTILSRCETIRLKLAPRQEVIAEAKELGVEDADAEILSYFYNDGSIVKEKAKDDDYLIAKSCFEAMLDQFPDNEDAARYTMQKEVIPALDSKPAARFFVDLLSLAFVDMVALKRGCPIVLQSYATLLDEGAKNLPHLEKSLLAVMTLRGEIETNINLGLLGCHLISVIYEE